MRLTRMTTRRWMLAVAVVALALAAVTRWSICWDRAQRYAGQKSIYAILAGTLRGTGNSITMSVNPLDLSVGRGFASRGGAVITDASRLESMAAELEQKAQLSDRMRNRSLRAMYRVWEPIPPAPPAMVP
jgi:hypothetical protein